MNKRMSTMTAVLAMSLIMQRSKRVGPFCICFTVYVLLYMLDCIAAVACVVMGLEATEDRKAAVREGGDKNAEGMATLPL